MCPKTDEGGECGRIRRAAEFGDEFFDGGVEEDGINCNEQETEDGPFDRGAAGAGIGERSHGFNGGEPRGRPCRKKTGG
jgi:hypothetical protein